MKKTFILLLPLLMVLQVGCDRNNTPSNKAESKTASTGDITLSQVSTTAQTKTSEQVPATTKTSEQPKKTIAPAAPQAMRDITSMKLVADMGVGWNLTNTLEAIGGETAWGNPITTKQMIDDIRDAGFKSVRIPVAWSNNMSSDYTINKELMDRVEEVVNYVLQDNMYAIVNLHWDGGWIANFPTAYDESMKKYKSIWTQVSERFKNYSDYLIFESMNEEGCWNDVWNKYGGDSDSKAKAYGMLYNINQEFVNLVRASGGNNEKRHLLIAGYATDIELTSDPEYKMPKDPVNRCIVSVHYYTPPTFAIITEDADWGKAARTWGTQEEIQELKDNFKKMKETFVDKGIPVIVGEFGTVRNNKEKDSVLKYLSTVCETVYKMNMCPMLWEGNDFYNRYTYSFNDKELAEAFKKIASSSR